MSKKKTNQEMLENYLRRHRVAQEKYSRKLKEKGGIVIRLTLPKVMADVVHELRMFHGFPNNQAVLRYLIMQEIDNQ